MRRTITTLIDDLDGTQAQETVRFALDGTAYEIDLSSSNAAALRAAIGPYASPARAAGRHRRVLPSAGPTRSAEIRAWAAAQGIDVPTRGRIPAGITQQFDASR